MKNHIVLFVVILLNIYSCQKESPLTKSELETTTIPDSDLSPVDLYIRKNFIEPYNIDVIYKWKEGAVNLNRFLVPPEESKILPILKILKEIWLEPYEEVGGSDFVSKIAPREILLVGNRNLNQSGTTTLGTAEQGARIVFYGTDLVDLSRPAQINEFLSTAEHEYTHILNQVIPFDETEFLKITPTGYRADWFNTSNREALENGFVTNYAQANISEDFAEMLTKIMTNPNYNEIIENISEETAKENLRLKEALVADYFEKEFSVDIYKLQAVKKRVLNNLVK